MCIKMKCVENVHKDEMCKNVHKDEWWYKSHFKLVKGTRQGYNLKRFTYICRHLIKQKVNAENEMCLKMKCIWKVCL